MLDLARLYLANVLKPVFEDPELMQDATVPLLDHDLLGSERANSAAGDDQTADGRSQALSLNESELNSGAGHGPQAAPLKRSISRESGRRRDNLDDMGLLDSAGPKLIHGFRSWLLLFQIVGQLNWLNVPFFFSIIYKACLIVFVAYFSVEHFIKPQMEAKIVDSNYKNPIFILFGFLAILTTLMHVVLTIYTNLFKLCPIFKVLTTQRLCFIKRQVQHCVGSKTIFFMLLFHVWQCILFQLLGLNNLNEFFTQFHIGRFVLDCFVTACVSYFYMGLIHIDFYIRVCFGFWIIAMKHNLEYRAAYLHRLKRRSARNLLVSSSNWNEANSPSPGRRAESADRPVLGLAAAHGQRTGSEMDGHDVPIEERDFNKRAGGGGGGGGLLEYNDDQEQDNLSANSRETNNTFSAPIINYDNPERSGASAQLEEVATLNSFMDRYKLDTMDEIQKNLNTMDDHLEVCRGIQNGSLVLITLNAFLANGAILLLAYHLLADQGKYFHGVTMLLVFANNSLQVFLCYIGDSWISYALGSFVQTVEDEYFLQKGDDGDPFKPGAEPAAQQQQQQQQLAADQDDSVAPMNWSIIRMGGETSDAGSETPLEQKPREQSLYLIKKKDVMFCREFLHQFENHLATPWSKLTLKIHLHMLGTFVTLIAAQIIFDREH